MLKLLQLTGIPEKHFPNPTATSYALTEDAQLNLILLNSNHRNLGLSTGLATRTSQNIQINL